MHLSHVHTQISVIVVCQNWVASGHVDLTSSVKRLSNDESPAESRRGGERDEMCETGRGRQEWSWCPTACVLMGSDVRLGQGWPSALVLCGWRLIFWSERVFGSVSRVSRRETRSFRNPLCCCGWPATIHSLIQDLFELDCSARWYWLCHNYNQAFIFIFFIASSLNSRSLLFHTGAIIQCMCLMLEAVQMYVCVCVSRCTIVLTAPLFLSVSCTLWLQ